MNKTTNYDLSLYEANDLPNLLDGYNNSMDIIDENMRRIDDAATKASADSTNGLTDIAQLKKDVSAETTRAKAAEEEILHITTDQETLINNEVTRAKAAEATNAAAIETNAKALANAKYLPDGTHILLIGDSYMNDDLNYSSKGLIGKSLANLYPELTFYNAGDSGSSFTSAGRLGRTFAQQIAYAKANDPDAAKTTQIWIAGGRNECGGEWSGTYPTVSTLKSAVENTLKQAKTSYPNAKVYVFPMLYHWNLPSAPVGVACNTIEQACRETGVWCAHGCVSWGTGEKSWFRSSTDIHPNSDGANIYATYMHDAVANNETDTWVDRAYYYEEKNRSNIQLYMEHGFITGKVSIVGTGSNNLVVSYDNLPSWLNWVNSSGEIKEVELFPGRNITDDSLTDLMFVGYSSNGVNVNGNSYISSGKNCRFRGTISIYQSQ